METESPTKYYTVKGNQKAQQASSCKNLFYMLQYIVAVKVTVPVVKYFSRIVAQTLQSF